MTSGNRLSPVQQLRELHNRPNEAVAFALKLLTERQSKDVLIPALELLAGYPHPPARTPLLALYARYARDKGVHDQGAFLRRAVMAALEPVARVDDIPMLNRAVETYEFWPPDFAEDAVLLRASALVALSRVDDELACFHAARLLVDPYTAPMTGEPAVTAARVLGAQGQLTALYLYAMQPALESEDHGPPWPEVTAECLRQLTDLPDQLLPGLVARFAESKSAVVRLGLYDLVIHHVVGEAQKMAYLQRFLAECDDLDCYRYLVMSVAAAGRTELLEVLRAAAGKERDLDRVVILSEAASILGHYPEFRALAKLLDERLQK
ncbi:MAG: hypothetical protein H3C34_22880 [Caldilineaceae bacterium]|nr:hypothetical protein [Caldilineaceae bacterium]